MNKQILNTSKAPAPIGPYQQAVIAGGFLFASGQIAIDPASGNLLNETLEAETHQVMKNMQAVLEEAGIGFGNVVKCSIFLQDMNDFAEINEIYGSYFKEGDEPARETVEVSRLPKDVSVEISFVAVV